MTTLRTLAAERGTTVPALMARLELTPGHHDPDAPLRPRLVALYRLALAFDGRVTA